MSNEYTRIEGNLKNVVVQIEFDWDCGKKIIIKFIKYDYTIHKEDLYLNDNYYATKTEPNKDIIFKKVFNIKESEKFLDLIYSYNSIICSGYSEEDNNGDPDGNSYSYYTILPTNKDYNMIIKKLNDIL
jgi:hypothetical protein